MDRLLEAARRNDAERVRDAEHAQAKRDTILTTAMAARASAINQVVAEWLRAFAAGGNRGVGVVREEYEVTVGVFNRRKKLKMKDVAGWSVVRHVVSDTVTWGRSYSELYVIADGRLLARPDHLGGARVFDPGLEFTLRNGQLLGSWQTNLVTRLLVGLNQVAELNHVSWTAAVTELPEVRLL